MRFQLFHINIATVTSVKCFALVSVFSIGLSDPTNINQLCRTNKASIPEDTAQKIEPETNARVPFSISLGLRHLSCIAVAFLLDWLMFDPELPLPSDSWIIGLMIKMVAEKPMNIPILT